MGTPHFVLGQEVEVRSIENGFRGSWYPATIFQTPLKLSGPESNQVEIEYASLLDPERASKLLREIALICNLRPKPPDMSNESFRLGEEVDVYHNDGWWKGVVTKFLKKEMYTVCLDSTGEEIDFGMLELRSHLGWVDGSWIGADGQHIHSKPSVPCPEIVLTSKSYPVKHIFLRQNLKQKKRSFRKWVSAKACVENVCTSKQTMDPIFSAGALVEVSIDDEELSGAWFPAVVLNAENNYYRIGYRSSELNEDLRETVDSLNVQQVLHNQHVRPVPPNNQKGEQFYVMQEVDLFYDYGWWRAVIADVLADNRYTVVCNYEMERREFKQSELRRHMDWIDGEWT